MLTKSVIHLFILSVATVIMTGCGSSKKVSATGSYAGGTLSWPDKADTERLAPQSQALLSAAHGWLGVPYKYGGNDRGGVDCSGLVVQVYQKALGIKLPRNSREQSEYCTNIAKSSLIPGDLIFFATGRNSDVVSHVGIFVGDNLMIHASASKGVILSDINASYYARTYAGSGIVDQYHAMIDDRHRKPVKPTRPERKTGGRPSQEGPVIHISQLESLGEGYTLTPVDNLPSRADTTVADPATATATTPANVASTSAATTSTNVASTSAATTSTNASSNVASATVTTTAATTATTASTSTKPVTTATVAAAVHDEPTPDEARAAVLNALKEKEL